MNDMAGMDKLVSLSKQRMYVVQHTNHQLVVGFFIVFQIQQAGAQTSASSARILCNLTAWNRQCTM